MGIKEDTPWALANRVKITNGIALFGYFLIFLNTISNILQGDAMGLTLDAIWFLVALVISTSNYFSRHYFVFVITVLIFTIMTDVSLVILGGSTIMTPMYIVTIVMSIFFFEKNIERIIGLVFIIFNYILAFFLVEITNIPIPKPSAFDIHIYFLFSVFAIAAITIRVLSENKKRLKETERLLQIVENKNEELEKFAYITSHDLKEPLRNIGSFAGLLERELKDDANQNTKEYLNFIKNNAIQLDGLVESVWDFVKISNTETSSFEQVDTEIVLSNALEYLTYFISNHNAQIKSPDNFPIVEGDAPLLTLVFQHLIENGIKFNHSTPPIVEIEIEKHDDNYFFAISDNGIGIEKDYHELIFQPYKTLQNKSIFKGSGVGLAICKRIIEQHGGKIWLNSKKGEGTTFYFSLPINK